MLKKYYKENHCGNVFYYKKLKGKNSYIMYLTNSKKEETVVFSDKFLYYLPYYVRSTDQLRTIGLGGDIKKDLEKRSKSINKNSRILPKRTTATNGIYGELFLDFYLRVIKDENPLIAFAEKSSYKDNTERKGIDNVTYIINEEQVEPCFAEAKFVNTKNSAHTGLENDIKEHITKEYLNDYIGFIVEKNTINNIKPEDQEFLRPFFEKLNKELDAGNEFINVLIENNICVNVVLFAIFTDNSDDEEFINKSYEKLYNDTKTNLTSIGFSNFNIEIVFIPINSNSMTIKEAVNEKLKL